MQATSTRVSGLSCPPSLTCLSGTNQVVLDASLSLRQAGKRTARKAPAWADAGYVAGTLLPATAARLLQ